MAALKGGNQALLEAVEGNWAMEEAIWTAQEKLLLEIENVGRATELSFVAYEVGWPWAW